MNCLALSTLLILLTPGLQVKTKCIYEGKRFYLVMPQSHAFNSTRPSFVTIIGVPGGGIKYKSRRGPWNHHTIGDDSSLSLTFKHLNGNFGENATALQPLLVRLVAKHTVVVYVHSGHGDGYTAVPMKSSDTKGFIVASYPVQGDCVAYLAIADPRNSFSVDLRVEGNKSVFIGNIAVNSSQSFEFNSTKENSVILIRSYGDLTGTMVTGTRSMFVFSGITCACMLPDGNICQGILEQMPRISYLGSNSTVPPLTHKFEKSYVRAVALSNESLTFKGEQTQLEEGDWVDWVTPSSAPPGNTDQYLLRQTLKGGTSLPPMWRSSHVILPMKLSAKYFRVLAVPGYETELSVLHSKSPSGLYSLIINGVERYITNISETNPHFVGFILEVSEGVLDIQSADKDAYMQIYIYSYGQQAMHSFPAACVEAFPNITHLANSAVSSPVNTSSVESTNKSWLSQYVTEQPSSTLAQVDSGITSSTVTYVEISPTIDDTIASKTLHSHANTMESEIANLLRTSLPLIDTATTIKLTSVLNAKLLNPTPVSKTVTLSKTSISPTPIYNQESMTELTTSYFTETMSSSMTIGMQKKTPENTPNTLDSTWITSSTITEKPPESVLSNEDALRISKDTSAITKGTYYVTEGDFLLKETKDLRNEETSFITEKQTWISVRSSDVTEFSLVDSTDNDQDCSLTTTTLHFWEPTSKSGIETVSGLFSLSVQGSIALASKTIRTEDSAYETLEQLQTFQSAMSSETEKQHPEMESDTVCKTCPSMSKSQTFNSLKGAISYYDEQTELSKDHNINQGYSHDTVMSSLKSNAVNLKSSIDSTTVQTDEIKHLDGAPSIQQGLLQTNIKHVSSSNKVKSIIAPSTLCVCSKDSHQALSSLMSMKRSELLLNTNLLTVQIRKKTSAPDDRASSQNVGAVGITLVVIPVVAVVFADVKLLVWR